MNQLSSSLIPPARIVNKIGCTSFAALLLALASAQAMAGAMLSTGKMNFVDANTVVIADWRAGQLHALVLPPVAGGTPKAFNLKNVSSSIARALHTVPQSLRFEDMAIRPGSELAYVSLSVESGARTPVPALVSIDAAGKVVVVNLAKARRTSAAIANAPASDKRLWRDTPAATYTVTDMAYYDNKLYVAGLSNATCARHFSYCASRIRRCWSGCARRASTAKRPTRWHACVRWRKTAPRPCVATTTTCRWRRRTSANTCAGKRCATRNTFTCCGRCWRHGGFATGADALCRTGGGNAR